jgi:hypothetical protein
MMNFSPINLFTSSSYDLLDSRNRGKSVTSQAAVAAAAAQEARNTEIQFFYKDDEGLDQGPYASSNMLDWYNT